MLRRAPAVTRAAITASRRYVEELKGLGYDGLTAEDLILLRDHGATAERIRAANTRAGTWLPIDMLRSLARRGGLQ